MVKEGLQKLTAYPEVITRLPEAELQVEGVKAWILQAERSQLVFFQFPTGKCLPSHSHTYDQWGLVVDGEMELTVAGKPRIFEKGDEYLIPAGSVHSAKFLRPTRVIDYFSEKNRYSPNQAK
ncbi:MAG TPA: cupin domain-containing protein [Candidatus Limnocylindrales bacterium]|nr:cupin domain-containing protein [Candidatus Limnocylindrales bacterium]